MPGIAFLNTKRLQLPINTADFWLYEQESAYRQARMWRTRQTSNHRFDGVSATSLTSDVDQASRSPAITGNRECGAPGRTRTCNPRFEAWYSIQLNYRCAVSENSPRGRDVAPASMHTQDHGNNSSGFTNFVTNDRAPRRCVRCSSVRSLHSRRC